MNNGVCVCVPGTSRFTVGAHRAAENRWLCTIVRQGLAEYLKEYPLPPNADEFMFQTRPPPPRRFTTTTTARHIQNIGQVWLNLIEVGPNLA